MLEAVRLWLLHRRLRILRQEQLAQQRIHGDGMLVQDRILVRLAWFVAVA